MIFSASRTAQLTTLEYLDLKKVQHKFCGRSGYLGRSGCLGRPPPHTIARAFQGGKATASEAHGAIVKQVCQYMPFFTFPYFFLRKYICCKNVQEQIELTMAHSQRENAYRRCKNDVSEAQKPKNFAPAAHLIFIRVTPFKSINYNAHL